jgi:hypothetical protein
MIRENHAVAASDGRVMFEGHIAGNDDEKDRFNKTFSLLDGKVVGAFSGLTYFDGRIASQHLQEIVTRHYKEITLFDDLVKEILDQYLCKLNFMNTDTHLSVESKKTNILLASGECLTNQNIRIALLNFQPGNSGNLMHCDKPQYAGEGVDPKQLVGCTQGDDCAVAHAHHYIEENSGFIQPGHRNLKEFAQNVIKKGICASSFDEKTLIKVCGGEIYTTETMIA